MAWYLQRWGLSKPLDFLLPMLQAEKLDDCQQYARLFTPAAKSMLIEAQAATDAGDISEAEAILVNALRADPSLQSLYNEVGRIYARKGETKASERCFHGFLPENFIKEYFKESYSAPIVLDKQADLRGNMRSIGDSSSKSHVVIHESETFVRHQCAVEAKRSIAKPIGIASTADKLFSRTELISSVAVVDQVANGKLWFDGYNRLVLDESEQPIQIHTRGCTEILHSICAEVEPYKVPGRCFLIGNRGFNNFCHWMVDILPSIGLFQQSGFCFKSTDRFFVQNANSKFQRECLHHFGIRDEQILVVAKHSPYIQAEELIVPFFSNAMALTMGSWVQKFLKTSFLNEANRSPIKAKKLYLARPQDARNGRPMPNEPELIEHLERRGFTAIRPEHFSVSEQAEIFAQADVVIAAHGAALTSIVFCRPGTSIIELYGDYMASSFWATSAICGLHYLNHYCGAAAEYSDSESHEFIHDLRRKGFNVDLNEIDQLLDLEEDTHPRT